MIGRSKQLVTNTVVKNYSDVEENVRYQIVIEMIKKMPIELLNEVFNIKVVDPDAPENLEIIQQNKSSNLEYIKELLRLKNIDCVQYECSFDVHEFKECKKNVCQFCKTENKETITFCKECYLKDCQK